MMRRKRTAAVLSIFLALPLGLRVGRVAEAQNSLPRLDVNEARFLTKVVRRTQRFRISCAAATDHSTQAVSAFFGLQVLAVSGEETASASYANFSSEADRLIITAGPLSHTQSLEGTNDGGRVSWAWHTEVRVDRGDVIRAAWAGWKLDVHCTAELGRGLIRPRGASKALALYPWNLEGISTMSHSTDLISSQFGVALSNERRARGFTFALLHGGEAGVIRAHRPDGHEEIAAGRSPLLTLSDRFIGRWTYYFDIIMHSSQAPVLWLIED